MLCAGHTALGLVGKSISKAHGEVFIAESIPTKPACYGLYHPSIYCGANRNRFTPQELNDQRCWTIEVLKRAKQDCDVDQATQSVAALNFASWKGGRDQPDQQVDAITAHYGDRDEDDSNCRHETPEVMHSLHSLWMCLSYQLVVLQDTLPSCPSGFMKGVLLRHAWSENCPHFPPAANLLSNQPPPQIDTHPHMQIGQMRQMMMRAKISDAAKGSRGPPLMPQPAGSGGYRF